MALTGGTGFLGTATLAAFKSLDLELAVGVHRRALLPAGQRVVPIEMETGRGFGPLVSGADALVHLATEISENEARCEAIIARGTERLVTEAVDAGVSRLLYVSNAAVYGRGIYCGASETEVLVAPVTPISRARVAAEDAVLAAGGVVLRPLFVYGAGDTRFIPSLMRGTRRLPFLPNGGRALLGTIAVHDLGAVICRMVLCEAWQPGVYHATDDQPASLAAIVQTLADAGARSRAAPVSSLWDCPYNRATSSSRSAGTGSALRVGSAPAVSRKPPSRLRQQEALDRARARASAVDPPAASRQCLVVCL